MIIIQNDITDGILPGTLSLLGSNSNSRSKSNIYTSNKEILGQQKNS